MPAVGFAAWVQTACAAQRVKTESSKRRRSVRFMEASFRTRQAENREGRHTERRVKVKTRRDHRTAHDRFNEGATRKGNEGPTDQTMAEKLLWSGFKVNCYSPRMSVVHSAIRATRCAAQRLKYTPTPVTVGAGGTTQQRLSRSGSSSSRLTRSEDDTKQ